MDAIPDPAAAQLAIWDDEIRQLGELLDQARDALRARDFERAYSLLRDADRLRLAIELTMYDYERACGRTWRDIGGLRGLTKQAAFNRYKRLMK